jgi:hypothetical protein
VSTIDDDRRRYEAATHGMQAGVAMKMNYDGSDTSPKHLRVAVNSAMSSQGGLVALLIEKGVITAAEYTAAVADAMERERDAYQAWLQQRIAPDQNNIRLG